jgi:hypothetical protein
MTNETMNFYELMEKAKELIDFDDELLEFGIVYKTFDDEHFYYYYEEDPNHEECGVETLEELVGCYPELEEVVTNKVNELIAKHNNN